MSADLAIPDSDEQMLARLAAMDMAAAEAAHARFMAAAEPDESARAGRTYQKMARSLRQTLMLKARLKQDRERAAREAAESPAPAPRPLGGVAVARRIQELTAAVSRAAWRHEPQPEAFDWYAEALAELIAEEREAPDFGAESLDDHVVRLCLAIGVPPDLALAWRDLPDPPPEVLAPETSAPETSAPDAGTADDGPEWRSSA